MTTFRLTVTALDDEMKPLLWGPNRDGHVAYLYEADPVQRSNSWAAGLNWEELASYKGEWLGWTSERDAFSGWTYIAPKYGHGLPAYIDVDVAEYAPNSNQVVRRRCATFDVQEYVRFSQTVGQLNRCA